MKTYSRKGYIKRANANLGIQLKLLPYNKHFRSKPTTKLNETDLMMILDYTLPKDLVRLQRVSKQMAKLVDRRFAAMKRLDLLDMVHFDWSLDYNQRLFEKLFSRCSQNLQMVVCWPAAFLPNKQFDRTFFIAHYVTHCQLYAKLNCVLVQLY